MTDPLVNTENTLVPLTSPYNPPYAGFWRRHAAAMLDGTLLMAFIIIPIIFISFLISTFSTIALMAMPDAKVVLQPIKWLFSILISFGSCIMYYGYFETQKAGVTPGRKVMGIALVTENGQPVSFGQSAFRQVMRVVSNWLLGLGQLVQLFTARRQTVYDKVCQTLVIRTKTQATWIPWVINVSFILIMVGFWLSLVAVYAFGFAAMKGAFR